MPIRVKRPIRRGLRVRAKPATVIEPTASQKIWAMRKRNWLELRVGERPKRLISRISVGETRLVGYGWEGGEHLGMLKYEDGGYIRYTDKEGHPRYMRLPEMRHGQILELEGTLLEVIRKEKDNLFKES